MRTLRHRPYGALGTSLQHSASTRSSSPPSHRKRMIIRHVARTSRFLAVCPSARRACVCVLVCVCARACQEHLLLLTTAGALSGPVGDEPRSSRSFKKRRERERISETEPFRQSPRQSWRISSLCLFQRHFAHAGAPARKRANLAGSRPAVRSEHRGYF